MPNSYFSTLASIDPTHYWLLDESAGSFADSGNAATPMALAQLGLGYLRNRPGPIRGLPRAYGFQTIPTPLYTSYPTSLSSNSNLTEFDSGATGALGLVCVMFTESESTPLMVLNTGTANNGFFLTAEGSDLSIKFVIGEGANDLTIQTDPGAYSLGEPFTVAVVQDGVAIKLYINGVDTGATVTTGGSTSAGDWIDALFASAATSFNIAIINRDVTSPYSNEADRATIQGPWYIRDGTVSAAQLSALTDACNFNGTPTDYYEAIDELTRGTRRWWLSAGTVVTTGGYPMSNWMDAANNDSRFIYGSNWDNSSSIIVDNDIVSDYLWNAAQWADATSDAVEAFQSSDLGAGPENSPWFLTDAVGTLVFMAKMTDVIANGEERYLFTVRPSPEEFNFYLIGSVLGVALKLDIEDSGGTVYTATSEIIYGPGATPGLLQFALVQDGSGVRFYVDGDEADIASSSGDDTVLFNGMNTDPSAANATSAAFSNRRAGTASWGNNISIGSFMTTNPLTVEQLLLIRQAYDGIFSGWPADGGGAFFDKLGETGNSGNGPDWWWRMNASSLPIIDIGSAQDRPGPTPPPINADSIQQLGDPLFQVSGPLAGDPTNAAIYFDGTDDAFEIGVNGVAGQLCESATGTFGAYFSRNALVDENIIFAIGDDAWLEFWQFGLNGNRLELIVQTSAGNRVTLTSSVSLSNAFAYINLTCDGAIYRLFIDGVEDTGATVVAIGTGAEGDWFNLITGDQTAMCARADSAFTTETVGRPSEVYLYDGEVLSVSQIAALTEAAISDGVVGAPSPVAQIVFENVTFKNGSLADIRAEAGGASVVQQTIRVNECKFIGGVQGDALYSPQCGLFKGPVIVQLRGCTANLQAANNGFGRGGFIGSAIDPSVVATVDGNISVSDCDFDGLGYVNSPAFLSPVMCLAAFGMTVEGSKFRNSFGTALGWLSDARRVSVLNNQITATQSALGAIYSQQALNARLGTTWLIRGNQVVDTDGNAIDLTGLTVEGGTNYARTIAILENDLNNNPTGIGIRANQVGDIQISGNRAKGCTEGIRIGAASSVATVRANEVQENSATGIICSEGSLQLLDLVVERNRIDGGLAVGDGITVGNVRNTAVLENILSTLNLGIQLGAIGVNAVVDANQVLPSVATPFATLIDPATSLAVGENFMEDLGNINVITQTGPIISIQAHHHAITAASALDLETINGADIDGFVLVLRRAPFSNTITVKDGIDNLNLAGDFIMATDSSQLTLVRNGADWNELARFTA